MKERPILFSAPMVRAILNGTKTQTRRVVKPQPSHASQYLAQPKPALDHGFVETFAHGCDHLTFVASPYGQPGDRLWVRETHLIQHAYGQERTDGKRWGSWGGLPTTLSPDGKQIAYFREGFDRCDPGRWRPSIHMPRWASRITLEVTDVRVERLKSISGADAVAEGVRSRLPDNGVAQSEFADLWRSINGAESWSASPWVWVVEFALATPERAP